MNKILHIFPNSLFVNSYLEFIRDNFKDYIHEFVIVDIGAKTEVERQFFYEFKITLLSTFKLSDVKVMNRILRHKDYDKIIVHSLYLNYLLLSFVSNKKILKKTKLTLCLWGGSDSRKFKVTKENYKYIIHAFFYERLRKRVLRNFEVICAITPEDYNNIVHTYRLNATYKECKYVVPANVDVLIQKNEKEVINIQVGHSGSIDSDTIEAINILSRFKNKNIRVYAPLAYGNEEYINSVVKYGNQVFGEKFIAVTELMSPAEYSKFIARMDILVMNTKIQQGLGNIYSFFYSRKKVYLRNDGLLWDFFSEDGLIVEDIKTISTIEWEKLVELSPTIADNNYEKSKFQFDNRELKEIWIKIFKEEN